MVRASDYFDVNWFLDGRRLPDENYVVPTHQRKTYSAMGASPPAGGDAQVPGDEGRPSQVPDA